MPRLFELIPADKQQTIRSTVKTESPSHAGDHPRKKAGRYAGKSNEPFGIPDFIAFDLETTGLNDREERIIEIGAVRFKNGQPGEEFRSFVNPGKPIPPFISNLTGISDTDVKTAPEFSSLIDALLVFIDNLPLCGHQIEFDINFLNAELIRAGREKKHWEQLDSAALSRLLLPGQPAYTLGAVSKALSVELTSAHRALDDARASGVVTALLIPRIMDMSLNERRLCANFCPPSLLKGLLIRSQRGGGFDKDPPEFPRIPSRLIKPDDMESVSVDEIRELFSENGLLSAQLPYYAPRSSQVDMACDIAEALNTNGRLTAEAGTGVGKTLAYLIPMALSAVRNHTRVFISTHTRNLQDQIISKDLPLAAKVIQGLTFSSLKGRSNYLCRHRWHRLLSGELGNLSPRERFGVLPLIRWAENTVSGDIEEQNQFNRKWFGRVWNLVAADSHNCLRSRCPGFDSCYVQRARRIALGSHCVVINHALFFSDMCAESPFLGDLGPIVFDEAHHLEECGHRYLRVELDTNRLERFIDICDNLLKGLSRFSEGSPLWESGKELKSRLKSMRTASELFLTDLKAFAEKDSAVSYDAGSDSDQFQIPYRDQPFTGSMGPATFEAAINALQDTILTTVRAIKAAGESAMDLADDASACVDRTSQLRADFAYVTSAITEDHVFWIEGSRKKGWIKLCGVPLDVGAVMRSVWDRDNGAIIFTSATMAVSDSMDFFLHKVGFMPGESRAPLARMYPSPFNPEQALRCVISGGVEPDDPQYAASVARSIEKLSVLNRNMLVLFTSNSMLSQVFESLRRSLSFPSGTLLLSQLAAGSRQTLLEQFRTSERAILLGADSFWEGIDVPGKSCEIVVIPRLPFQVPSHPLTQALSARAEALYGDSFINHSLPEALVRFRQGTGRLIRTTTDNGMLVVLDPRMTSRRYGKLFMKSVHAPFTVCPTIDEAIARADSFFEMKG